MMREFALPAEPRIARRLSHLSSISGLQICPETAALASEGLLTDDELAACGLTITGHRRQALQRILDQDLRALVLVDEAQDGMHAALAAAKLTGALPIVIVVGRAHNAQKWERACAAHGWRVGVDAYDRDLDVLIVEPESVISQPVMGYRRGGVLVIDDAEERDHLSVLRTLSGPAREFPRTIALYNVGGLLRSSQGWSMLLDYNVRFALETFFSREEIKILDLTPSSAAALRSRGFTKTRPADLYQLFGVVTDLLGAFAPK